MILVKENLFFIQKRQREDSSSSQIAYHAGARISLLGTSLLLIAESILRTAISALAGLAYLVSCGSASRVIQFAEKQIDQAQIAAAILLPCFLSVFSPETLEGRLLKSPMAGTIREFRMRLGEELIQTKLKREFQHALNQTLRESDGEFRYKEGAVGTAEREILGGMDVGVCHFLGGRASMQNTHVAQAFNFQIGKEEYQAKIFGIFEGHGGSEASAFVKEKLKSKLQKLLVELNAEGLTDEGIWNALKMAFVHLNLDFKGKGGTTASVALFLNGKLWSANVGDSRTFLHDTRLTIPLSEDATPNDPRYVKGVENRGGFVRWNYGTRVNGELAAVRSIGDHCVQKGVSARPKIICLPASAIHAGSHLVICSSRIYDVASSKQVGKVVKNHKQVAPHLLAQNIVYSAYQAAAEDNLSALVIRIF